MKRLPIILALIVPFTGCGAPQSSSTWTIGNDGIERRNILSVEEQCSSGCWVVDGENDSQNLELDVYLGPSKEGVFVSGQWVQNQ